MKNYERPCTCRHLKYEHDIVTIRVINRDGINTRLTLARGACAYVLCECEAFEEVKRKRKPKMVPTLDRSEPSLFDVL